MIENRKTEKPSKNFQKCLISWFPFLQEINRTYVLHEVWISIPYATFQIFQSGFQRDMAFI